MRPRIYSARESGIIRNTTPRQNCLKCSSIGIALTKIIPRASSTSVMVVDFILMALHFRSVDAAGRDGSFCHSVIWHRAPVDHHRRRLNRRRGRFDVEMNEAQQPDEENEIDKRVCHFAVHPNSSGLSDKQPRYTQPNGSLIRHQSPTQRRTVTVSPAFR
jgi:hypothetical protein